MNGKKSLRDSVIFETGLAQMVSRLSMDIFAPQQVGLLSCNRDLMPSLPGKRVW